MPTKQPFDSDLLTQKLQALAQASRAKIANLEAQQTPVVLPTQQADILDTAGDIGIKLAQGVVDVGQSVVGLGSLATGGLVGKGMRAIGYDPEATNQFLGQYLSDSQRAADQKVADAKGFKETLLASLENPRSILGSVAESLPGMVAGMGVSGAAARAIGMRAVAAAGEDIASVAGQKTFQAAVEQAQTKLLAIGAGTEGAQSTGQIVDQAQAAGRSYSDYALPAVAAGVGTAGINLLAGKLMGDAATDMATGTHTLKGNFISKILKEGFSEGVLEEMPQSAQEQIFTNIATGKPYDEGVGNAAASGLLAGAAMGAGMGGLHGGHEVSPEAKTKAAERAVAFKQAVETNDSTPFRAEASPLYNPTLAAGALFKNDTLDTATPESKFQNLQEVTRIVGEVSARKQQLEQQVKSSDRREAKAAQDELKTVSQHYDAVSKIWDDMASRWDSQTNPEEVQNQIAQADAPLDPSNPDAVVNSALAADRIITLAMANTRHMSAEQAQQLADNQDNALTDEQRGFLRTFSEARVLENSVKQGSDVSKEIYNGSQKNLGIVQYRQKIGTALSVGDTQTANYYMELLSKFAEDHTAKAEAVSAAVKSGEVGTQVQKKDDKWVIIDANDKKNRLNSNKLKENGGVEVRERGTEKLLKDIRTEAQALVAVHAELLAARDIKASAQDQGTTQTGQASVQSITPTPAPSATQLATPGSPSTIEQNTVPQGKSLLEEIGKDEARLEIGSPESVAVAPQNGTIRGNTLNNSQGLTSLASEGNPSTSSPASPASQPSAPIAVAGAPAQGTAASLASAGSVSNETQPVAAEQPAAVSVANPAPAAEVATAVGEKQSTLSIMDRYVPKLSANLHAIYQMVLDGKVNLVAQFLKQEPVSEKYNTQRPLASVPNFLSAWQSGEVLPADFLETDLDDKQRSALGHFFRTAASWLPLLRSNFNHEFTGSAEFRIQDMMQSLYLADENGQMILDAHGRPDIDQNIKTAMAYAGYEKLLSMIRSPLLMEDSSINAMFGREKDEPVPMEIRDMMARTAGFEDAFITDLGTTIVQALGLKERENAPADILPRLKQALGVHVLALLEAQGYVKRNFEYKSYIDALLGKEGGKNISDIEADIIGLPRNRDGYPYIPKGADHLKYLNEYYTTVELVRGEDTTLPDQARDLRDSNGGAGSVLDKLFAADLAPVWAPVTPQPFTQENAKRTDRVIPQLLKDVLGRASQIPHTVHQDMFNFLVSLGADGRQLVLDSAGHQVVDERIQKNNRGSLTASNQQLERAYDLMTDMWIQAPSGDILSQAWYVVYSVWKNFRVGIATQSLNPQTSKIHRFFFTRPDWTVQMDMGNTELVNLYKVATAAAFGEKTDKKKDAVTLASFEGYFAKNPDMRAAIDAIKQAVHGGGQWSQEGKDAVRNAAASREGMQTLQAMVNWAKYEVAMERGDTSIEISMLVGVDGKTNGPMLTFLALGAGKSVDELYDTLRRGGFYPEGEEQHYSEWYGKGNKDLYEALAASVMKNVLGFKRSADELKAMAAAIKAMPDGPDKKKAWAKYFRHYTPEQLVAVETITKNLVDEVSSTVTKFGRDLVKTPLTGLAFGSALKTATRAMEDKFLQGIYDAIQEMNTEPRKVKSGDKEVSLTPQLLIQRLNVLIKAADYKAAPIPMMNQEQLNEWTMSKEQVALLRKAYGTVISSTVKETMKADMGTFLTRRAHLNSTIQGIFSAYSHAHNELRQQLIEAMMKKGEIASRKDKNGKLVPRHDLTADQEDLLARRIAKLLPVTHTAYSKLENNKDAGLYMAKVQQTSSGLPFYRNEVMLANGLKGRDGKPIKKYTSQSIISVEGSPGVAGTPYNIHSLDSANMHMALAQFIQSLNVHDEIGNGLDKILGAAQAINEATVQNLLNFSPTREALTTLETQAVALVRLLKDGTLSRDVVARTYQDWVAAVERAYEMPPGALDEANAGQLMMQLASRSAFMADQMRLGALARIGAVDQYTWEGGHFADDTKLAVIRGEAAKQLAALKEDPSKKLQEAIKYLDEVYAGKQGIELAIPDWANEVETSVADDLESAPAQPAANAQDTLGKEGTTPFGELGLSSGHDAALVGLLASNPTTTLSAIAIQLEEIIGAKDGFANYQRKLTRMLLKLVGDTPIHFITKDSPADLLKDAKAVPDTSRGFTQMDGQGAVVYVLSPEYRHAGLTPETLLHELVHAAVIRVIENPSDAAKPMVENLKALLAKARDLKISGFDHVLYAGDDQKSLHELVAWGMNNQDFQNQVLKQIKGLKDQQTNSVLDGLKKFVRTIATMLGLGNQDNGLYALINNTAGLFAESSKAAGKTNITLAMASAPNAQDFTVEQVYDALGQLGNRQTSPGFDGHLRDLLKKISSAVSGPFDALKQAAQQASPQTPLDLWAAAKAGNVVPFASEAMAAPGLTFSEQEAFALDQVEATVRAVLQDKEGSTTAAYRELTQVYEDARDELKGKIPQDLYDFVFKMQAGTNNESDYLSRFAALGLANAQFNAALQFNTPVRTNDLTGLNFGQRLAALFENFLTWIHGKLTHTFEGQAANEKLTTLVQQLVDIEQRKKMKIQSSPGMLVDGLEQAFRTGAEKVRGTIEKAGQSSFFQSSSNSFVKLAGTAMSQVAGQRLDHWMNALQEFRDKHIAEQNGIMMGIINEIRGATDGTKGLHKMLRMSKEIEGKRKDIITGAQQFTLKSFDEEGKYLEDEHKAAITQAMRLDLSSLLEEFDLRQLEQIVTNPAALDAMIHSYESQLTGFTHYESYISGSRNLGLYLATNKVGGANLRFNAGNIAEMLGTQHAGRLGNQEIQAATAIIDPLVSLYGLRYSDAAQRDLLGQVLTRENARQQGNGMELVLKMHRQLQQESRDRLFESAGRLAMKGYVPEVHNPYIEIKVADSTTQEARDLEAQGYRPDGFVTMDRSDPDFNPNQRIYVLRDGGLLRYQTGIVSFTGLGQKGTEVHNGNLGMTTSTGLMNRQTMARIAAGQQADISLQANNVVEPTGKRGVQNYLVPVFNAQGEVVNYRYMMQSETRDRVMERDNRFDYLMGVMAGSIFDKQKTKEQNHIAVRALHEQYLAEFGQKPHSYTMIGEQSADPKLRELWRLLPDTMKQSVRDVWGTNHMWVRYDHLDITFGYRKMSITDPFNVPSAERNRFQEEYVRFMEYIMGPKAKLYLRRGEEVWQSLVAYAKDTMVVKSGLTLLGNETSNVSELIWFGVPLTQIWNHHRVALKGVMAYRKDGRELADLERMQAAQYYGGRDAAEVARRIVQLKDALARNPVRELVEAGLMPTIVEDVSVEDDQYSFEARFDRKVDDFMGRLNPSVVKAAKFVTMAHDTPIYQGLSFATQVSDFLARYTLYQDKVAKGMSKDDAMQLVSDAFVNYDVPSHRVVQFANDNGLVYFSKYYLRIQKVIGLLYRQNPGRALMLLTAGHFLDFIPMLTHSSVLHRFGNPFSLGAFEAVGTLDEMATIKALMTPFR